MSSFVLFVVFAALLLSAIYILWRYWYSLTQVTPEEEAYDEEVAALNERQATRLSDEQLTRTLSEDDAWNIMVARGERSRARRDRYGGDLGRRRRERRRP